MQSDQQKAKEFVRILLETILGKKVSNIKLFSQLVEQGRIPGQHGIQMDSYVEACVGEGDETKTMILPIKPEVFDIEPNTYPSDSEERRMRYYRALIDSKLLAASVKYKELPNVTLIMISDYDPFGQDCMVYTIRNKCDEAPDYEYEDGVRTIFLYAYGKRGMENRELASLLRYLADSRPENVTSAEIESIQKMVEDIKRKSEIGVRYMQSWEIKQISHDEGYDEGYGQKLIEDIENVMQSFHVDLQTACKSLKVTVDEYEKAKKLVEENI